MNITSVDGASAFQSARIKEQIGMAMLAKTMSIAKQQGQNAIELIESAADTMEHVPGSSHQLDIKA